MAFKRTKTSGHSEIKQTRPSTKQDFSGEACSKQNTEASLASLSCNSSRAPTEWSAIFAFGVCIYEMNNIDEFACKALHKLHELASGLHYAFNRFRFVRINRMALKQFSCVCYTICSLFFAVLSHCLNHCVGSVISKHIFYFITIAFCVSNYFTSSFIYLILVLHPLFVCFSFLQAMFISLSLKSGLVLLVLLEQDK